MHEFILAGLIGAVLIGTSSLTIYEVLRFIWASLPRMKSHPRWRMFMVIGGIFGSHIINIWIFGLVYYVLMHYAGMGTFYGAMITEEKYTLDLVGCLYFSAVAYSTLGLGDITPEGALRMIASAEALTGFILIGWTVSFIYLTMEKFWELPHKRNQ